MAWLTSLLKKPEPEVVEELAPEPPPPEPTGPRLAVLVPDTNGISSFRITQLPDAYTAAEHIGSLPADIRHETHAFWAMHDRPLVDPDTHVEALVLIRAQAGSDLVYVVSFLDIESAFSFTRFEVRRGLHLGNVMIYWAAFAQLREEFDGVSITPEFAPPTENYIPPSPVFEEIREPEIVASVAVAEPEVAPEPVIEPEPEILVEPEPHVEDEADTRRIVEEYLRRAEKPKRRIIEPAPEPVTAFEPPVAEAAPQEIADEGPVALEPVAEFSLADDDEDLGPMWPDANRKLEASARAVPEITSPVAEEQHAIQEAFVFQHKTIEKPAHAPTLPPVHRPTRQELAGIENGMVVDDKPEPIATFGTDPHAIERLAAKYGIPSEPKPLPSLEELAARLATDPEPAIETFPGDEELEFVPLNSAEDDPTAAFSAPKLDDFDIAYEVERLLRGRKWEQRNGPFSGFQSPPGRF